MIYNEIQKKKKRLRNEVKIEFLDYSIEELDKKSQSISNKIENYVDNNNINSILCYYPIKYEVNILKTIEKWLKVGNTVVFLSEIGGKTVILELQSLKDLEIGSLGILEPRLKKIYKGKIDLAIVPGLIFSKEGIRIGKGFGFFDKFFENNKNIYKLGVCYDFQIRKDLKKEVFDVNMEDIVYA